jgi:anaerobic selenocysteine-containing dehydrogenase
MIQHSYCRQCIAVCGLLVTVDDDRIVAVRGDPDHPVTRGYTCSKGRAFGAMHHDPDRLDHPELRVRGRLVPVSWDDLLDDLATHLARLMRDVGTDAIGTYFGSLSGWDPAGRAVAETFHHRLGSRSRYTSTTTDCPAKPLVAQAVLGHAAISPLPDLQGTTMLLLLGTNPIVSHGHTWALPDPVVALRSIRVRGEVWVVDPRTTETARSATRHLAPRADTDYAVLGHLLRELLASGSDEAYLRERCTRLDELRASVALFDVDHTTTLTGLSAAELDDLVAAVRRAGRVSIVTGTGVTMGAQANVAEWFAAVLMLVTGSFDQLGGMWCNPGLLARLDEAGIDARRSKPAQAGPPSRPELPRRFGQYPCVAMADEIEAGNLRALLSLAGNPVASFAEPDRVADAFRRLEVLAVADIRRNTTTALATHVLPCTGAFERPDVTSGAELYQPFVAAQYVPALVAPVAERRPLWWITAQLARRLGFEVLPGGLDVEDPATDDEAVLEAVVGIERLADVRDAPSGATADVGRFGWVIDAPDRARFDLAPVELVAELDRVGAPAALVLIPRRQGRHVNTWFPPSTVRQDHSAVFVNPADAADAALSDGQRVRVRSAAGALEGTLAIDDSVSRGVVSIPHGFVGPEGPNVGVLISSTVDVDPLTGMVRQSGVPVSLESPD